MFLFLQKLQLGPIDAAFQELQYALNNSVRALLTAAVPLEAPSLVSLSKLFGVGRFKVNGGQSNLASGPPPSDGDARDDAIWRVERPWGPSGV